MLPGGCGQMHTPGGGSCRFLNSCFSLRRSNFFILLFVAILTVELAHQPPPRDCRQHYTTDIKLRPRHSNMFANTLSPRPSPIRTQFTIGRAAHSFVGARCHTVIVLKYLLEQGYVVVLKIPPRNKRFCHTNTIKIVGSESWSTLPVHVSLLQKFNNCAQHARSYWFHTASSLDVLEYYYNIAYWRVLESYNITLLQKFNNCARHARSQTTDITDHLHHHEG